MKLLINILETRQGLVKEDDGVYHKVSNQAVYSLGHSSFLCRNHPKSKQLNKRNKNDLSLKQFRG